MSGSPLTGLDAPQPEQDAETPPGTAETAARRGLRRRVLIGSLVVLLVLVGGSAAGASLYARSIDKSVVRIEAFDQVPAQQRPQKAPAAGAAMNILILGSDTRDPDSVGGSRSDTIIVLHLPKKRTTAQLISIPRDTWVHVPKSPDNKHGDVTAKINAAFAWGGPALTVQTVEAYTGVRIDHVVMVDFAGFKEIVDALGGVTIDVEKSFTSRQSLQANHIRRFEEGTQQMDGAAALDYARDRYSFPDGDFARIRHQQQVIRAILNKASSGGILTNPARLNAFLHATADTVAVDDTLDILGMATDLRHLRGQNLAFYTSPSSGTGMVGSQSVVFPDRAKAKALFDAVRADDVAKIAAAGVRN
jgi:LCP family protein required for cell wall assembly